MRLKAVVKGVKSLDRKLKKLQDEIDAPAVAALAEGALMIHSDAVRSIQAKDGVKKMRNGKEIIVSEPGNPPNTQTGRLVRSIRMVIDKVKRLAQVGTDLKYGLYLEFGGKTPDNKKYWRPWLRPAYKRNIKVIGELYARRMREAVRKLTR